MSAEVTQNRAVESRVALVKGTADLLPDDFSPLAEIESLLLDRFARSGYAPIRVPVLENRVLHERKSGSRIVANLYQVDGASNEDVCLRPELTAGIVRAFNEASPTPSLPWRVSYSGPVFRLLPTGPRVLREFQQVGVERLDTPGSGTSGDAETIWLAHWALSEAGISDATIRIGHAGLIRELLDSSGLPRGVQVALVEVLSESVQADDDPAVTGDRFLSAIENHLESLTAWLSTGVRNGEAAVPADDTGAAKLFHTLYPEVVGRRAGRDVIARLRRKWELGQGLSGVLGSLRDRLHELADLRGPAPEVLARLSRFEDVVPTMTRELRGLVASLQAYGIDPARVELDLGFGRGIGFYSQMMFVLLVDTPNGSLEVCGGGRYDGLARALGSAEDVGGVGFAFGLERLRDVLAARGIKIPSTKKPKQILVVARDANAFGLASWLRGQGLTVVIDENGGARSQTSDRRFDFVVEGSGPSYRVTDLASGKETTVPSREDLLRLSSPTGGRSS